MTRETKPRPGYRGLIKGSTGVVYPTPVIKKVGEIPKVTITYGN